MEILGNIWFTPQGKSIGIVVIQGGVEKKAYIGIGQGIDEGEDLKFISEYGTPFPLKQAMEICNVE